MHNILLLYTFRYVVATCRNYPELRPVWLPKARIIWDLYKNCGGQNMDNVLQFPELPELPEVTDWKVKKIMRY